MTYEQNGHFNYSRLVIKKHLLNFEFYINILILHEEI